MLVEVARRELGAVLELTQLEDDGSSVACPEREALDVREARRVDGDHHARLGLTGRLRGADEDVRRGGDDRDDQPRTDDDGSPAHAPVPVLPGAWTGVPAAHWGHVSGPGS